MKNVIIFAIILFSNISFAAPGNFIEDNYIFSETKKNTELYFSFSTSSLGCYEDSPACQWFYKEIWPTLPEGEQRIGGHYVSLGLISTGTPITTAPLSKVMFNDSKTLVHVIDLDVEDTKLAQMISYAKKLGSLKVATEDVDLSLQVNNVRKVSFIVQAGKEMNKLNKYFKRQMVSAGFNIVDLSKNDDGLVIEIFHQNNQSVGTKIGNIKILPFDISPNSHKETKQNLRKVTGGTITSGTSRTVTFSVYDTGRHKDDGPSQKRSTTV
jgi:hypothetical protein